MRRTLIAASIALLSACDGYTYKDMDGSEARAQADSMPLQNAYSFYIETYKGVHPPMLDVAPTFERFGKGGTAYLSRKALDTEDPQEFEADLTALLVLDFHCDERLLKAFVAKSERMGSTARLAQQACGST